MVKQKKVYVNSFGRGRLLDDKGERILLRTKKAYELFFYLFHFRDELVTKDDLVNVLYPNMITEKGGSNLHTTIYQIRKEFEKHGYSDIIVYKSGTYFINTIIDNDYDQVKNSLQEGLSEDSLLKMLNVYDGQYFEKDGYEWSEYLRKDIHSKIILSVKEAILLDELSNIALMQFLLVFRDDCLSDLELLGIILDNFLKSRDQLKIRKVLNEAKQYWKSELSCDLPGEFVGKYE
ncbi:hypothetical protein JNUCC83_00490 [Vagococcus sp. JNUCC 83]